MVLLNRIGTALGCDEAAAERQGIVRSCWAPADICGIAVKELQIEQMKMVPETHQRIYFEALLNRSTCSTSIKGSV